MLVFSPTRPLEAQLHPSWLPIHQPTSKSEFPRARRRARSRDAVVTTDMIPGVVGLVGGETATDQTRTGWGGGAGTGGLAGHASMGGSHDTGPSPPDKATALEVTLAHHTFAHGLSPFQAWARRQDPHLSIAARPSPESPLKPPHWLHRALTCPRPYVWTLFSAYTAHAHVRPHIGV